MLKKLFIHLYQPVFRDGSYSRKTPSVDNTNRYWFAKAYPNHLLQQETWDGRTLKLNKNMPVCILAGLT